MYFYRHIPKYFIVLGTNVNGIVSLISNPTSFFLVYRKPIDFYTLTLYPATLQFTH